VPVPNDPDDFAALLRKLGARRPEIWVVPTEKGRRQELLRFLFLREAWSVVVEKGSSVWIENYLRYGRQLPAGSLGEAGRALKRIREAGAADQDITTLVRQLQAHVLFQICYLIDGTALREPEVADIQWNIFEVDEDGNPLLAFDALAEYVGETDPAATGD
jgi:hypothetical protein